jgi:hypothetical protein
MKYLAITVIVVGICLSASCIVSGPQAYWARWISVVGGVCAGIMLIGAGVSLLRSTGSKAMPSSKRPPAKQLDGVER